MFSTMNFYLVTNMLRSYELAAVFLFIGVLWGGFAEDSWRANCCLLET